MPTLLIRLAGPMQAWGTQSRFDMRDTGLEPSKSAVVGLLAAALGRARGEPIDDLASLNMGVRVLHEGVLSHDYHTVLDVPKASGAAPDTVVSQRYFLADAEFLVALQHGERGRLARLDDALRRPRWPLYLGRRAFPPTAPISILDGLIDTDDLDGALKTGPPATEPFTRPDQEAPEAEPDWLSALDDLAGGEGDRLIVEVAPTDLDRYAGHRIQRRMDQPVSFAPPQHAVRYVRVERIEPEPGGEAA